MDIITVDTTDRRQVRQFLALPFRLYRQVPQWVPPLDPDARLMLDRQHHPFYQHSAAEFFLAVEDGRAIGRLAVLDNHNYNVFHKERTAFFCLFECENNPQAARGLFEAAVAWARQRGLERLLGPKGFTALDGVGLLVQGFEHRPAFGVPYNLPYYAALVEAAGLKRKGDVLSGHFEVGRPFPSKIHEVARRIEQRRGLHIARFKTRRDLEALVPRLGELYNSALDGPPNNVPLTLAELRMLADQLLSYADPRLVKAVMKGDEMIGYLFAYPDVSAAVQRSKGRLWPLGWLDLLLEFKRTPWVNVSGAGILRKFRGPGGMAILFSEMHKSIIEGGFKHADLVQISADDDPLQHELRDLGIDLYKAHRLYERPL